MSFRKVKTVRVTFSNGEVWDIPAAVIADARAVYYEDRDPNTTYTDEFCFTMGDNSELLDWASNNMNWEDVKEEARLVSNPESIDYESEWINAHREIVNE